MKKSNSSFRHRRPSGPTRLSCLLVLFLLSAASAQVRPVAAEAVTANLPAQRIGASDLVAVSVYDVPELTRTVRVGADGLIRLPMLKRRIKAEGLMPAELETAIASALVAEGLIVDPFVTVNIAEYKSRPISVMGAVKQPLTFQADGPVTLLEALTKAGGLSPEAGSEILVSRAQSSQDGSVTALVQRILVKGLVDAADPALNITLIGGEEVRVPEAGRVYVIGNVKKPGAFVVQDGVESTVLKMLAMSEGLMPYASKDAYIYRREANGSKNEIQIPLSKIMDRKAPDAALLANDILYVPDNKGRRMTLGALEKVMAFGAGAGTALIYAGVR